MAGNKVRLYRRLGQTTERMICYTKKNQLYRKEKNVQLVQNFEQGQ